MWLAFYKGYVVDRDDDLIELMIRTSKTFQSNSLVFRHTSEIYDKDEFGP